MGWRFNIEKTVFYNKATLDYLADLYPRQDIVNAANVHVSELTSKLFLLF